MTGRTLFASYAFPPNELGYCGPADAGTRELAATRRGIRRRVAVPAGHRRRGGSRRSARRRRRAQLLGRRSAARQSRLGRAADPAAQRVHRSGHRPTRCPRRPRNVLAHHSFHVFVRLSVGSIPRSRSDHTPEGDAGLPDPMGHSRISGRRARRRSCRRRSRSTPVRWRSASPLAERVRWSKDGASLAPAPAAGRHVAAHWDWMCGNHDRRGMCRTGRGDAGDARPGQPATRARSPLTTGHAGRRSPRTTPARRRADRRRPRWPERRCARRTPSARGRRASTAAHRAELALDEFVEFRQPHATQPTPTERVLHGTPVPDRRPRAMLRRPVERPRRYAGADNTSVTAVASAAAVSGRTSCALP